MDRPNKASMIFPSAATVPINTENEEDVAIKHLQEAIILLEQTKDKLRSLEDAHKDVMIKRIACLCDELEVLISHKSCPEYIEDSETVEETDFDIADPNAPSWHAKSHPYNDDDFEDTDEEFPDPPDLPDVSVASLDTSSDTIANFSLLKKASIAKMPTIVASTAVATAQIEFAPPCPLLNGSLSVCGINIKWRDTGAASGSVSYMCDYTAKDYSKLTANNFKLNVATKTVPVPYDKSKANLHKAESFAKNAVNVRQSRKYDRYSIVSGLLPNHAAGDTIHLSKTLITTSKHELGHVLPKPHALQHASLYVNKSGKWVLESSRDGLSYMSIYSAYGLSGPQQYSRLGMPEDKVAQYTIGSTIIYKMQLLYPTKDVAGYLRGVNIPNPTGGMPMFLSLIKAGSKDPKKQELMFAFHNYLNGGSGRIGMFKESFTFNGLNNELNPGLRIERVDFAGELATVKIGPAALSI